MPSSRTWACCSSARAPTPAASGPDIYECVHDGALTGKACKNFTICGKLRVSCLAVLPGGCGEEVISRSLCDLGRRTRRLQLTQRRLAEGEPAEFGGRVPAVHSAAPERCPGGAGAQP